MLVLTRRPNEKVLFPDQQITIQVLSVRQGAIRLGIDAPPEVPVLREELQPGHEREKGSTGRERPRRSEPSRQNATPAVSIHPQIQERIRAVALVLAVIRRQQQLGMTPDPEAAFHSIEHEISALTGELEGVAQGPEPAPAPRPHRALLVEDDQNERELLAGILRLSGVEVDTVKDGADALEWLHSREQPDILLCDMGLPRCDGPTVVRTLRCDPAFARLKIYGVTGHRPESLGLEDGPGGVDHWFRKPLDPAMLLAEMDREWSRTPPARAENRARP